MIAYLTAYLATIVCVVIIDYAWLSTMGLRLYRARLGNLLLDHLLGATLHFEGAVDYYDIERDIDTVAARLTEQGRRPYAIPVGGASVVGAAFLGWVVAKVASRR